MTALFNKIRKPEGKCWDWAWFEKIMPVKTFAYANVKFTKDIESEVKF